MCETYKGIAHLAPRRHHLVEDDLLALGCQHEHQAARLKGKAVDELTGQDGHAAVAVHVHEVEPILWNRMCAIGLLWIDLKVDRRARHVGAIAVEAIVVHFRTALLGHDDLLNVGLIQELVGPRAQHACRLGNPRGAFGSANVA